MFVYTSIGCARFDYRHHAFCLGRVVVSLQPLQNGRGRDSARAQGATPVPTALAKEKTRTHKRPLGIVREPSGVGTDETSIAQCFTQPSRQEATCKRCRTTCRHDKRAQPSLKSLKVEKHGYRLLKGFRVYLHLVFE